MYRFKPKSDLRYRSLSLGEFFSAVRACRDYELKEIQDTNNIGVFIRRAPVALPYYVVKNGSILPAHALFSRGQRKEITFKFDRLSF